jgi:hypothetical protein
MPLAIGESLAKNAGNCPPQFPAALSHPHHVIEKHSLTYPRLQE